MTDDIQRVVDTTNWPPMVMTPGDQLQRDCQRLEAFARPEEIPQLQECFDTDAYAKLTLDQKLLMRRLQRRAEGLPED